MSGPEPILFAAPGAGLGHLSRAYALALRLAERGIAARIVSNSPYARGLSNLAGLELDYIPAARWRDDLPGYAARLRPRLVVLDSFPWGLKGEWVRPRLANTRFVYLARRLQIERYCHDLGIAWGQNAARLKRVIIIEPLAEDHERLLLESGAEIRRLPGRVRLPANAVSPPVPEALREMLERGRCRLVVHSGSEEELKGLIGRAQEEMAKEGGGELAVISPRPLPVEGGKWFEYFPASRLFGEAHRIVSGAGYNLMAEAGPFAAKHLAVPLPRKYDDQPGRLAGPPAGPEDGGPQAAKLIAGWLD
jgi:hypothetical protein